MPRNKNNNSRGRRGDGSTFSPNNNNNIEAPIGSPLLMRNQSDFHFPSIIDNDRIGLDTEFSDDVRSLQEKVNDLDDIFVNENHVDRDVIEAVLDGCNGDVNDATDKLFEMISTAGKAKRRLKRSEENDLAVIACSILGDESASEVATVNQELPRTSLHSAEEKFRKNYESFDSNQMGTNEHFKSRRGVNGPMSLSGHSFPVSDTTSYNFYSNSTSQKPQTEQKLLFKPEVNSQEFLVKNSFEDMARNMEQNAFATSKSLGRASVEKDGSYFSPNSGGKSSNMSSTKFDISENRFNTLPDNFKNISMPVTDKGNKNSFLNTIDPSSDPVASFISGSNISPDVSAEWDAFYKEHNLEPISERPVQPDLDFSKILNHPLENNSDRLTSSAKDGKSNFFIPKKSGKDFHGTRGSEASDLDNILRDFPDFSPTDLLSLVSQGEERHLKIDSTDRSLNISPNSQDSSSHSSYNESPQSENFSRTTRMRKNQSNDHQSNVIPDLLPSGPKSTSLRAKNSKNNSDQQHVANPFTAPQPLTPLKIPKGKNIKKVKKQPQPSNESVYQADDLSNKFPKHRSPGETSLINSNQKAGQECKISPKETGTGSYDPFGWGEINEIISSSNSSKPQPQRATQRARKPSSNTPSPVAAPTKDGLVVRTTAQTSKESQRIGKEEPKSLPPRLPPSLAVRPSGLLPPASPLLSSTPTKSPPVKGPPAIQKPSSISLSQPPVYRNKVELVGMKTPRGLLRHYLQWQQPVMVILRGLPGSGKTHLARELMEEITKAGEKGVLLSTDDYFVQSGQYSFNRKHLELAHDWNKQRAFKSVKERQPYVIIDNTNSTLWELLPYAEMAVQHQYDLRVCEPDTPWKNKVQELFRKNEHGVPRENIKRMKERYEVLTTERVIEAACKSLTAKGRFTTSSESVTKKVLQRPNENIEENSLLDQRLIRPDISKPHENSLLDQRSIRPDVSNYKKEGVTNDSILSDLGLTEWTASQEQRVPNAKGKKKMASGALHKPLPKVQGPQITLDFLNNSLKKAMVDIERMQKDTHPIEEDTQTDLFLKADDSNNQGSLRQSPTSERPSLNVLETPGDVSLGHGYSSVLTEVCIESEKSSQADDQSEKSSIDNEDRKEESSLNELNADLITNQVITKVSAEEVNNSTKELPFLTDREKAVSPISPRAVSPGSSQNEDCSSVGLESSWTSGSFHSCKSDEGNDDAKEDEKAIIASVGFPDRIDDDVISFSAETNCSVRQDLDSDLSTPVTVIDAMEFMPKSILEKAAAVSGELNQEGDVTDKTKLLVCDEAAFALEKDPKNFKQAADNIPSLNINNTECAVRRLPSFTGSLVQYDDSDEEESGDEDSPVPSQVSETKEDADEINKHGISSAKEIRDGDELSEEKTNLLNDVIDYENTTPSLDDEENAQKSLDSINTIDTSSISHMLDMKNHEQNTQSSSDVSDNSPVKKAKKKRIRKGHNRGPFLEETLVAESKSKDWNSFFVQPQPVSSIIQSNDEMATVEARAVAMVSQSVQCEPYYFTLVYRLNSTAFSEEAVDLSICDVSVVHVSDLGETISTNEDLVQTGVTRKYNMCDQSTMTDETLNTEEVDLYILLSCFPMYSRKYLEEVMSICGNNLEWVTNHLIDSPPLIDTNEEQGIVSSHSQEEVAEKIENESESPISGESGALQNVKSLASLAREVVKKTGQVDPDDLEVEVIRSGQMRLRLIENFGKERLHSVNHDEELSENGLLDDFRYNYFSGPLTPEECWEWNPNQEILSRMNKPLYPIAIAPTSPTSAESSRLHSPAALFPYSQSPASSHSRKSPFRFLLSPQETSPTQNWTAQNLRREQQQTQQLEYKHQSHQQPLLQPQLDDETEKSDFNQSTMTPTLPFGFVRCLENLYGPLGLDMGNEGLPLDDRIARKIFNCLKLQTRRKLPQSFKDDQLKEDEALARALQDEEDARMAQSAGMHGGGKPNTGTSNSTLGLGENTSAASQRRFNSVSDTLHYLRGTVKPKRTKFVSRTSSALQSSAWVNPFQKRATSNLHSIIEEEKAREELNRQQMQLLRAAGDTDALATKLKRQELCRKYPMVESDLMEEIFRNNCYSIEATERSLESQYDMKPVLTQDREDTLMQEALRSSLNDYDRAGNLNSASRTNDFQHWPAEDETVSYDDLRREAQMYRDLAKECQQKALRHQREGMPSAGLFYRQEAKKYKAEENSANQRAASVLFDRGSERLRRENTLDLHSFHLDEAIKAVNTAIDMKRDEYQQRPDRKNTYVNVITGRGQNSKGGIPRLKPAIINHLLDRNFKFEEKTSGMLKVYIFSRD